MGSTHHPGAHTPIRPCGPFPSPRCCAFLSHVSTPVLRRPAPSSRRAQEVPIYGRFRDLAYFYADVFVGTPPQKFTVIADTGSTLLAFPCKGCSSCGAHLNPKFDVSKSSTVQSVPCAGNHCTTCSHNHCGYHQSYAEGSSLAGVYYKDLVWLGGASSSVAEGHQYGVDFQFGCHSSETSAFI